MIFAKESVERILDGTKRQTRRPANRGECRSIWPEKIDYVLGKNVRIKWKRGNTYAINPPAPKGSKARCGKQVGRIRLLRIRREPVNKISQVDAIAEGVERGDASKGEGSYVFRIKGKEFWAPRPDEAYLLGWKYLYPGSDCTEDVWVLDFEYVGASKPQEELMGTKSVSNGSGGLSHLEDRKFNRLECNELTVNGTSTMQGVEMKGMDPNDLYEAFRSIRTLQRANKIAFWFMTAEFALMVAIVFAFLLFCS
jgi:hypothetical protein